MTILGICGSPRKGNTEWMLATLLAAAGAAVGAADALGYHAYDVTAMWRASGTEAAYAFDALPISWEIAYAYNRWRPSLLLSAWSTLDTVSVAVEGATQRHLAEERSRGAFTGLVIPWRRVRLAQSWLAGAGFEERSLPDSAGAIARSRNGVRAGWTLNSSRQYGYSVSPEDGIWTSVNVERVMPALAADGEAWSLTWDLRGYRRGFAAHQVAALRLAGASSTGDAAMRRTFDLGGTGVPAVPFAIGHRAIGLLRGLPQDAREGPAALVANVDYRFPIVRVERGIRTWPFFLRDVHGALFADIGSAGEALDTLPDVAAVAETLPGYEAVSWGGVMVPAGTPKEIVNRLNAEINKILKMPDVAEKLQNLGAIIVGSTPEEFDKYVKDEIAKWGKVARDNNIALD